MMVSGLSALLAGPHGADGCLRGVSMSVPKQHVLFLRDIIARAGGAVPSTMPLRKLGDTELPTPTSVGDMFRAKFPGADYSAAIKAAVESKAVRTFRASNKYHTPMLADASKPFTPGARRAEQSAASGAAALAALGMK